MKSDVRARFLTRASLLGMALFPLASCEGEKDDKVEVVVPSTLQDKPNVDEQAASQLQDAVDAISAVDTGGVSLCIGSAAIGI